MAGARCVARQSREADNRWPRSGIKAAAAHIAHATKPALHPASSALAQNLGLVAAIRQGVRWRRSGGRPRVGPPRAAKGQHGLHIPMHRMARVSKACTVAIKPWEVGAAEPACGPMSRRRWWMAPTHALTTCGGGDGQQRGVLAAHQAARAGKESKRARGSQGAEDGWMRAESTRARGASAGDRAAGSSPRPTHMHAKMRRLPERKPRHVESALHSGRVRQHHQHPRRK